MIYSPSSTSLSAPKQANEYIQKDTILVVDDNPTNLTVLCDLLGNHQYEVAVAQDGEEALERVGQVFPALILLDVMMPGIDGFETCQKLKANPRTRDIPVLFMTALADTINKVHGLDLGAVDYITKPFDHAETVARIQVHLALRKAQVRLIQKEKMAALGMLVAGIAHEITNPVNFIKGNLKPAREYTQALLSLVNVYEASGTTPPEAQAFAEDIEFEFIKDDFPQLLSSMDSGTQRITKIVNSLQIFSCLDEAEYKEIDLHCSFDSILLLLKKRLQANHQRPKVEIVKTYGELPLIGCYPSQLNQALINLIVNAVDTIDEKFSQQLPTRLDNDPPTITVETDYQDKQVIIRITDTGMGIPTEIGDKVFDQFFTTKPVGKGTGLGLSVCRSIVENSHSGQIVFTSEADRGTTFQISFRPDIYRE